MSESELKHHPLLTRTTRTGQCDCSCGWSSGLCGNTLAAHLRFGGHLIDAALGFAEDRPEWRP